MPLDVGDQEPSEAIQDLPIGKIRPVEVKESTSSIQVEAPTSHQGERQVDMEASTSGTRQDDGNEEVQQDDPPQPPSPPPQRNNDNINEEEEDDDDEEASPQPKKKLP